MKFIGHNKHLKCRKKHSLSHLNRLHLVTIKVQMTCGDESVQNIHMLVADESVSNTLAILTHRPCADFAKASPSLR